MIWNSFKLFGCMEWEGKEEKGRGFLCIVRKGEKWKKVEWKGKVFCGTHHFLNPKITLIWLYPWKVLIFFLCKIISVSLLIYSLKRIINYTGLCATSAKIVKSFFF